MEELSIQPLHPWVLVKLLPKKKTLAGGLLVTPEHYNKTWREGVVLKTWRPVQRKNTMLHSELSPGMTVMFPHWAGQPCGSLAEKDYRLVKEKDTPLPNSPPGEIMAVLDQPNGDLTANLAVLLGRALQSKKSLATNLAVQLLLEHYIVIPKQTALEE